MTEQKKSKYKIIYKPIHARSVTFYTDNYELVDKGYSIKFTIDSQEEPKIFPYILCEIKVQGGDSE